MNLKKSLMCMPLLLLLAVQSGCYMTPVRHLAADVSLLKIGVSTGDDVRIYLGEPDEILQKDGADVWIYRESEKTFWEKAPAVGKYFGSPEYRTVLVTLRGNVVVDCAYNATDDDDRDWARDFSWQEQGN